ncbi:MAG: hypothetical protein ACRDH8_04025, partial [Actinomycetota bacterium]
LGIGFDHPNYEEFYERLNRLRSVRDYQMPVQSVSSNDYETVAEIFARVNTGGRRLSKGDLVMSAIAARWDEGVERVEAFETELRDQDFPLHREAVLRLMSVMAGVGADHVRLLRKEMDGPALKQAWETTQDALRVGIQFLKNDAGIPKSGLLTSPNVTVVPSYLLHKGRERLSPREAELLVRWTYTAMAFSRYSNQVESKLDAEIKVLDERRGEEALTDLIRRASDPRPVGTPLTSSDLLDKKSSSALFHLMYIRALRSKAKDWWNNLALADTPVGRGHKIEYHHIFPKARLKGRYTSDLVDSVANLAFLSALGNKRVSARDPAKYLANADSQELNKQWIPSDKILWDVAKFEQFLGARRTLIADALNEMLGLKDQTSTADLGQTVGEDPEDAVIDELQEESDELWTEE